MMSKLLTGVTINSSVDERVMDSIIEQIMRSIESTEKKEPKKVMQKVDKPLKSTILSRLSQVEPVNNFTSNVTSTV